MKNKGICQIACGDDHIFTLKDYGGFFTFGKKWIWSIRFW